MKLKYYLRGMGIGIIVTTIILAVSFSHREVEISDEEVMARAAVLGMVMQKEDTETDVHTDTDKDADADRDVSTESDMNTEADVDTESALQDDEAETDEPESNTQTSEVNDAYRLVIRKGDVCRTVCEDLAANGVISDAEVFRSYLFEIGYANNMRTGEYDIPYGLTAEEVAGILQAGPNE